MCLKIDPRHRGSHGTLVPNETNVTISFKHLSTPLSILHPQLTLLFSMKLIRAFNSNGPENPRLSLVSFSTPSG